MNFLKKCPLISKNVFVAKNAMIIGNVKIKENSSVYFNAVLRADNDEIVIGERTNIQDGVIIHVDEGAPVTIGDDCTVGHGAIIHGCSIGNNTVVGMGSIILNGVKIGSNCIIGAGALVTQNTEIPDNSLVVGTPAKIKREVTAKEIENNLCLANLYVKESATYMLL